MNIFTHRRREEIVCRILWHRINIFETNETKLHTGGDSCGFTDPYKHFLHYRWPLTGNVFWHPLQAFYPAKNFPTLWLLRQIKQIEACSEVFYLSYNTSSSVVWGLFGYIKASMRICPLQSHQRFAWSSLLTARYNRTESTALCIPIERCG